MTWLSGFSNRLKLTIDSSKVDETLTNFPVNITLSYSTGITDVDTTVVFDELTVSGSSWDNRKKIAITNSNDNQLYIEIEYWDSGNEIANLWTKVPTISSGTDTDLYLYYDSTKSDNTTYVGDTGDSVAQNVWDSNFKAVYHMSQDPSGGTDAIKDSTSNVNHGTSAGSMTSDDLVDGKIGKAIDFDGVNDYINFGNPVSLHISDDFTIETLFNTSDSAGGLIGNWSDTDGGKQSFANLIYNGKLRAVCERNGDQLLDGSITVNDNNWHYLVSASSKSTGNSQKTYCDGVFDTERAAGNYSIPVSTGDFNSAYWHSGNYLEGIIDDTRISDIVRSPSWIKATYYSNWNTLLTYGNEQNMLLYYYDGYVKEHNIPVSRVVRLYCRSTGELVSSDISDINTGSYYLTTSISGEHFIVAFDDNIGAVYNALIEDRLLPKGIE